MKIGTDWNHYHYTYGEEGREALVHFDVECAVLPSPSTHQTTIRVRLEGPEGDFEASLKGLLASVECWLVGVMRYAEGTAFVFQVEDAEAFQLLEPTFQEAAPGAIRLMNSAGWGYFDDQVCPNEVDWQRITDREQLARLVDAGLDPDADTPIAHGFYGTTKALSAIRERLETEGFEVVHTEEKRLEMQRTDKPVTVSAVSVPLARFARRHGAAYDGWHPS